MVVATVAAWLSVLVVVPADAQSSARAADAANQDHGKADVPDRTAEAAANVLTADEWQDVDQAVERALTWLARQQQKDGSFPTTSLGQPAVTCLCTMAFMAHGHVPGDGIYGKRIERAVEYVLQCQKENGLITLIGPDGPQISRNVEHRIGNCAAYNHAISSLMLCELYGTSNTRQAGQIQSVINKALAATLQMQRWPKDRLEDKGGWRYLHNFDSSDSDLSITGWELKFLRSARNAGFNVPKEPIDEAVAYVRRCYSERHERIGKCRAPRIGDQQIARRPAAGGRNSAMRIPPRWW